MLIVCEFTLLILSLMKGVAMASESEFQSKTIQRIKDMLPECVVLKNDPNYIQGIPDFIILHGPRWAALEFKKSWDSPVRPNQAHYVFKFDSMSFACFVFPENVEEVLRGLQRSFAS